MIKYHITANEIIIGELSDLNLIISEVQDILDIIGDIGTNNCNRLIIDEANFHADFFRLKTQLAGDMLQKFSNYGVKLAIVGDFSKYRSTALRDFIRECNRGNLVFFVDDRESALARLSA